MNPASEDTCDQLIPAGSSPWVAGPKAAPSSCAAVFTATQNYMPHLATALTSLLHNNRGIMDSVYVIHDGIDPDSQRLLASFAKTRYQTPVVFLQGDHQRFKDLKLAEHFTHAAYLRLLMDELLPSSLDRVLYLDADCIVLDRLTALIGLDFNASSTDLHGGTECYVGAADHWYGHKFERRRVRLNMLPGTRYFNSGVLVVNLKLWRREGIGRKAIQLAIDRNGMLPAHDQDVVNILFQNAWHRIHPRYNVFGEIIAGKASECDASEMAETLAHPAIIHFTGASKPWHYLNEHPYKHLYWHYRAMTPWKRHLPEDFSIKSLIWKHLPVPAKALIQRRSQKTNLLPKNK
jgi:lipopolysaccharide biosynthesis glycosyltransferase